MHSARAGTLSEFTRTSGRAGRIGAFALEMWSRLLVDGTPDAADERARELSWMAENICALHGVRTEVHGTPPKQPSLLVANHISYFDPLIIASQVPLIGVAKQEVGSWPWVGSLLNRFGVLYVCREDPLSGARVLREAMRFLERGVSVLIFPEGTTTHGTEVLPFKRGSFGAACLSGVPIVPVALRYECTSAAWVGDEGFVPHYVRTVRKRYTHVQVDFLPALAPASVRDATGLAERARRAITDVVVRGHSAARRVQRLNDDVWSVATA